MAHRIEKDSFGPIEVPAAQLWGAQTQRSLHHFHISTERMAPELVAALAQVKRAAAEVNRSLGKLDDRLADAIVQAADEVLAGQHASEFPLSVWQTGSGTQSNMNMNEVLANRASELLGGERGEGRLLHPNDHVNMGQSSNDIFPTAMHVAAALAVADQVLPALARLRGTLVLLMAVQNAPAIAAALVDGGRSPSTPVAVVVEGTMPEERTVLSTLGTLEADLTTYAVTPPAIIVVGDVVAVAHPERYG
jgi:fumarate hydratase class II